MCNEREQLIEYVYGETGVADRRRIEAHLDECHECRTEMTGLRGVRDDLLAWAVPKHEPIWRPFVPVSVPTRRTWSTWALATAASTVFAAGLAGGMAARGWLSEPAGAATTMAAAVPSGEAVGAPAVVAAVTADDLARLEATLLDRVRTEMAEQLQQVQVPTQTASMARIGSDAQFNSTETRLAVIEEWMDDQIRLNNIFNSKFGSLSSRTSSLSEQIELSRLQRINLDGGMR